MSPSRPPAPSPLGPSLLLAALAFTVADPGSAARYKAGDEVVVSGIVTDEAGTAVPGLEIVVSGHRESFNLWSWKQKQRGESSVVGTTDERGSFSIVWRWDKFYNRFSLTAGIRQPRAGEQGWWQVAELDLTDDMYRGSPVVANLQVEDAAEVRDLKALAESLESDDALRVYQELGRPEETRRTELRDGVEVSWWYFERGMLYRFVDGRLESSESFEPVPGR